MANRAKRRAANRANGEASRQQNAEAERNDEGQQGDEAQKHSEGAVARGIEHYTAQMSSDWFLWAAGASILGSLTLQVLGRKQDAQFVGQWAPTFLILGLYNKIVKVAGSDRVHENS